MKPLLRSLLLAAALIATNVYAYDASMLNQHSSQINEQTREMLEAYQNQLRQSQPELSEAQAKSLAKMLLSSDMSSLLSRFSTDSAFRDLLTSVGPNLSAEDIENLIRANPNASLLELLQAIGSSNTNQPLSEEHLQAKKKLLDTVNDLIEQADDQSKEDGKTPRTYPEGQSPAAVKAKLAEIKTRIEREGYVPGLGGMENAVTGYGNTVASWNSGTGNGHGAGQNQLDTQQNAVTNAINSQMGTVTPAAAPSGNSGKFCYTVDGKTMCH